MRWIVSDFFMRSPLLLGPVIALLLFLVVFTAIAIHAFRTAKSTQDRMARLPFNEDGRHD
jgi:cbb3-type cytochrome oxidase subunit 3